MVLASKQLAQRRSQTNTDGVSTTRFDEHRSPACFTCCVGCALPPPCAALQVSTCNPEAPTARYGMELTIVLATPWQSGTVH